MEFHPETVETTPEQGTVCLRVFEVVNVVFGSAESGCFDKQS